MNRHCNLKDHSLWITQIAKAIPRATQKGISHEVYSVVLKCPSLTMTNIMTIRSFNHNLYTIVNNRRGVSSFDDKNLLWTMGLTL